MTPGDTDLTAKGVIFPSSDLILVLKIILMADWRGRNTPGNNSLSCFDVTFLKRHGDSFFADGAVCLTQQRL